MPKQKIPAGEPCDYEITIQCEEVGTFKELIRAGVDALGDDAGDLEAAKMGKALLGAMS